MSDYIPDTEEVRELYWAVSGEPRRESGAWDEFDRWLRKVQAEAWEEGYLDGDADRIYGTGTENPYREDLHST